ncbi:hypothetical protein QM480_00805 [Flectobacillus sp. DC10W]|uniref:Uncharacterized protein n=1 Tax=Flectobacillus longus TaxID=2984207 RepID=A0ABT6YGX7_9BACT|nr:hypothetical protein [Flectobacillus longus]MDI9862844.1 hypothetical protein [Flectobacillus longus]
MKTQKYAFGISLLLFLVFIIFLQQYCYNFFFADDYHLLRYVTDSQQGKGFREQISLLFDLHNEHRIIFPRLFTLLIYQIEGFIDWKTFNIISLFYYLGICWIFNLAFNKLKVSAWYFLPIPLLLFHPLSHENIYWTISILQQVGNLFWAMLLFWLITNPNKKYFYWAFVVGFVLTFTHGNGLFGLLIAGVILFLTRRIKDLLRWALFTIALFSVYFYQYRSGQNSNVSQSLHHIDMLLRCFFTFWGSITWHFTNHYNVTNIFAACTGVFIVGPLIIILGKYFFTKLLTPKITLDDRNLFLLACFGYLLVTSALVALSRAWIGYGAGLDNRYAHNSLWAIALLYLTLLLNSPKAIHKTLGVMAIAGAFVINVFGWYSSTIKLKYQFDSERAEAFNYRMNGVIFRESPIFNSNIKQTLALSYKNGISKYSDFDLDVLNSFENATIELKKDSTFKLTTVPSTITIQDAKNPTILVSYLIEAQAFPYNEDTFLMLHSDKANYLVPVEHKHGRKTDLLFKGKYFGDGFYATFLTSNLPKGKYQYSIVQKNDKTYKITLLEQFLEI